MELQTPGRQISQAVLLQQEACLIQEAFNRRFQAVQAGKKDLIGGVEERMARSVIIERELGLHGRIAMSCGVLVSSTLQSGLCRASLACAERGV